MIHARSAFILAAIALSVTAVAEEVEIVRDTWGVPHIYAETEAGVAYGIGYAQAEDRLEDIHANVRTAIGRMSEAFGAKHLQTDYAMHLADNAAQCQAYYPKLPEKLRQMTEAYFAGVAAYEAKRPDRRPEYAVDLEPWHALAIGRAMVLKWPLGTLQDDYGQRNEPPEFSSNSYAVSPKRSADGCAILLNDPHLTWESLAVFWEGRAFGGELHMNGFWIVGSPLMALGHNADVGWAMTTGGPDTSDVYQLKLNPEMPLQYEYDGEWKQGEIRLFDIPVKGEEKPRSMPAVFTMHGPLLGEPDYANNAAYAGKTPYMDDMGLFEQMYAMVTAKDADEFYDALKMNHLMEQNIMYADRNGTIGYARVGRTPIRPEGYDWKKPVPGWTSETAWQGIHDLDDHVRIVNPPQGYMQNCNISPANMMRNSPLKAEKYPDYLYNVSWDENNPRGKRMVDLLAENEVVTGRIAKSIAMDVFCPVSQNWLTALGRSAEKHDGPHFRDPLFFDTLLGVTGWDATYRKDERGAFLMREFRLFAEDKVDVDKISAGKPLSPEEELQLIEVFHEAMKATKLKYGRTDMTWGEMFRVGRGGETYPCDGADYGRGDSATETVRDVEYTDNPDGEGFIASGGAMATMLMFFYKDGIESHSCIPWGQSANPDSPHYTDQARELYSQRKFKPTWGTREALAENTASSQTITYN